MVAERFLWAESILKVKPSETVLEIGCGTGIMLEIFGRSITSGKVVGIDRSDAMVQQARKKNNLFIEQGKVNVLKAAFPVDVMNREKYDKIFAINVNLFWTDDGASVKLLYSLLKKSGCIYLFYQPPVNTTKKLAAEALAFLRGVGCRQVDLVLGNQKPVPVFCLKLTP